jgi:hypothetical protein
LVGEGPHNLFNQVVLFNHFVQQNFEG